MGSETTAHTVLSLAHLQKQQILPDAPPIAKALATDSAVGPAPSSMSTKPLTTSIADPLPLTLPESKCGE
jgi:hypothetical protein